MTAPGSLRGTLLVSRDQRVASATIGYQPIADPAPVLGKRSAQEAIKLIDLLYGVCRHAHGLAARRALGISLDPEEAWRLECATRAESAREAMLQAGWHWPRLLSAPTMPIELINGAVSLVSDTLTMSVNELPNRVANQERAVAAFLQVSPAQAIAAFTSGELAVSDCSWLDQVVDSITTASYSALPMADEMDCTNPVAGFLRTLADYFRTMAALRSLCADGIPSSPEAMTSSGSADITTCRGRLTHEAALDQDNRVLAYRIDAPTTRRFTNLDWTRPGLAFLKGLPVVEAERALSNWLAALDPCGGVVIERGDADA